MQGGGSGRRGGGGRGGGRNWADPEWRAAYFAQRNAQAVVLDDAGARAQLDAFVSSGRAEAPIEGEFDRDSRDLLQRVAESMGLFWCAPLLRVVRLRRGSKAQTPRNTNGGGGRVSITRAKGDQGCIQGWQHTAQTTQARARRRCCASRRVAHSKEIRSENTQHISSLTHQALPRHHSIQQSNGQPRLARCSTTYGSGTATKRTTVVSRTALPRHDPRYDNYEVAAKVVQLPADACAAAEAALAAFEKQGVSLCAAARVRRRGWLFLMPRWRAGDIVREIIHAAIVRDCTCRGRVPVIQRRLCCKHTSSSGAHAYAGLPSKRARRTWGPGGSGGGGGGRRRSPSAAVDTSAEAATAMAAAQEERLASDAAQGMLTFRKMLPSFEMREAFLQALREQQVRCQLPSCHGGIRSPVTDMTGTHCHSQCQGNAASSKSHFPWWTCTPCVQVVIVSGETGCGKTTQLPQFILEDAIAAGRGPATSIICTQPRRISAVSIAQRVAQERGEAVGGSVGYKIRLEGESSAATRLLFCTSGVLLRRLISDPELSTVSHVVVDEIHERGINEDLLLIILRDLLPVRPDLKLVLMSATLNAASFQEFFPGAAAVHIPGFTFPVDVHYLDAALEASGVPFVNPKVCLLTPLPFPPSPTMLAFTCLVAVRCPAALEASGLPLVNPNERLLRQVFTALGYDHKNVYLTRTYCLRPSWSFQSFPRCSAFVPSIGLGFVARVSLHCPGSLLPGARWFCGHIKQLDGMPHGQTSNVQAAGGRGSRPSLPGMQEGKGTGQGGRGGRGRGAVGNERSSPFDTLDSTPPSTLSPGARAAYTAWWDATAEASAAPSGKGMVQPDFVAAFVQWLHGSNADSGAILVFLPGFEEIKQINELLQDAKLSNALVIPLHGALATVHQRSIFERPPPGVRKIVLATNIAETSITIDDVTTVVDCGVHKVTTYDALNKIRQLSGCWCALFVFLQALCVASVRLGYIRCKSLCATGTPFASSYKPFVASVCLGCALCKPLCATGAPLAWCLCCLCCFLARPLRYPAVRGLQGVAGECKAAARPRGARASRHVLPALPSGAA